MRRPPRPPEARLLDRGRLLAIAMEGLLLSAIALGAFAYSLYALHQTVDQARTVAFTVMVLVQLVHAFNCRNRRLSVFRLGIGTNPALLTAVGVSCAVQVLVLTIPPVAAVFKVVALPVEDWALMAAAGLVPLVMMELVKAVRKW
jgi:Ca2+-transporting ATPase